MKNPNYNFIRCIFIQCFSIEDNQIILKFIKSSLHYDNEFDLLQKIMGVENMNILLYIDYDYFIPKLDAIIKYYCFLHNEFLNNKNIPLLKVLKKGIKLVLDFLDKVIQIDDFKKDNSKNNDNSGNIIEKEEQILINSFIQKLFECSCIKLLFILYFHIFREEELKDLKNIEKYILFSINRVYNPFYFYFLLPMIDVNNDSNLSKKYKMEIIKMIITKIIIMNNTNKINSLNNNKI